MTSSKYTSSAPGNEPETRSSDEASATLDWDTAWWGFPTAIVTGSVDDEIDFRGIDAWCKSHQIRLLYFLCPSEHVTAAQRAEDAGFRLMDIRIALEHRAIEAFSDATPRSDGLRPRLARFDDALVLGNLAAQSFRFTRFYADPGLPDGRCDDLYRVWMEQECRGDAEAVFLVEDSGQLAGYISCSLDRSVRQGRIGLVGVSHSHRGKGIGSLVLAESLSWFKASGALTVTVVTQGRNASALRLYERSGFGIRDSSLWFHKWYSTPQG